jgi:hypothetical protein
MKVTVFEVRCDICFTFMGYVEGSGRSGAFLCVECCKKWIDKAVKKYEIDLTMFARHTFVDGLGVPDKEIFHPIKLGTRMQRIE